MSFDPLDLYFIYDDPVPYKDLLIYPVSMKNYIDFYYYASCLVLEKNSVPDVKIISMSYLEYLYSISNDENRLTYLFDGLLRLVLKNKDLKAEYVIDKKNKPFFILNDKVYNSEDFENIRIIISKQNNFDLIDEKIQKKVRDEIEKARRYKNKLLNKTKMASLEDQMIFVAMYTGWDLDKIYNMTIRKFTKTMNRINHFIQSQLYLQANLSGMVEFKDKSVIQHWLIDLEDQDKNKDVTVDLENIKSKVEFNNTNTE